MRLEKWLGLLFVLLLTACAQPATPTGLVITANTSRPSTTPPPMPTATATAIATATEFPTSTPVPARPRIVFASNRGSSDPNKLDLFILDLNSLEITPLNTGLNVLFPQWSPDGSKILFTDKDVWNLYTINVDGTNLTQVTNFRSSGGDWSPDGKQVVFQSDFQNTAKDIPDIYTMDVGGENLVDITNTPAILDIAPRWSPDSRQILYASAQFGSLQIVLANADGSNPLQLTQAYMPVIGAEWSPDGSSIVYVTQYGREASDLSIINNINGSLTSIEPLTQDPAFDGNPTWSPDGTKIAFFSNRSGNYNLWLINPDGTGLVQLTNGAFHDAYPDWAP